MTDLKWLEQYNGETTEELLALEGKYRTDSLVVAFHQAVDQKAARVGNENLAEEERIILAVEALESEVNNGGYDQFFINSSKEYAPMVVEALQRIGCAETATLTQEAIDALGVRGPITAEAIERVMQKDDEKRNRRLTGCDERYFAEAGDLSGQLLQFIKANRMKVRLND